MAPLRLARRFTIPLLAAAACILVIVAVAVGSRVTADHQVDPPAVIQPTPTVAPPTGNSSSVPTSAASSPAPSTSAASTSSGPTGAGSTTIGSSKTGGQASSPVTVLPPSTGAPASFRAAAVDFLDTQTGGAIGDAQCAAGTRTNCPALIRTDDGGVSWHRLTFPAGLSSATLCSVAAADVECVFRLKFADSRVGYVWGGTTMFLTVDGGAQWKQIPTAEPIGSVAVSHGHLLRVMGDRGNGSVKLKPAVIETSPVGSTSFSVMSFPIPGVSVLDLSVMGAGPNTAYAVAYVTTQGKSVHISHRGRTPPDAMASR